MNKPPETQRLTPGIFFALAALFIVVGAYYLMHKPISPDAGAVLFGSAVRIILGFAILSVAGGLGHRLLNGLPFRPLLRSSLQGGLGAGLLAIVYLVQGWILGYSSLLAWVLLVFLGWLLWQNIWGWWQGLADLRQIWLAGNRLERIVGGVILILSLQMLVNAVAPPLKFDALVYHFLLPAEYLRDGEFVYYPWMAYWGMPQLGEMLFTWAAALLDIQVAAVVSWGLALLTLLGVLGYGSNRFGVTAGWAAAASLMAGHTLAASLSWGYVDWNTALYGLGVIVFLDQSMRKPAHRWLYLAGIFAGFGLGAKYTGGILALAGVGLILWKSSKNWSSAMTDNLRFGGMVILASFPWWVKNYLATGHPFYPFFIPAGAMTSERLAWYQNLPVWGDWQEALFLPWRATFTGIEGAPGFGASIGPLMFGLAFATFVGFRNREVGQRQTLRSLGIFLGLGLIVWAVMGRLSGLLLQSRLYMSLFPAAAVLAGVGFDALQRIQLPGIRLRRVAGAAVLLVLSLNLLQMTDHFMRQGAGRWLFGQISTQEYLLNNLGMYALVMENLKSLPQDSQVLMLWEPRSYYCRPVCIPDDLLDRWRLDLRRENSWQSTVEHWRSLGFTHILIHHQGAEYFRGFTQYLPADWQGYDEMVGHLLLHTDFNQVYRLYDLTGDNP